jgi:DNA-binding XRE family transcriptional regulator
VVCAYTLSKGPLNFHTNTVALPFCLATLSAEKPQSGGYPKALSTIGDHTRRRRLDLGLLQKDIPLAIGVDTCTITDREKNSCAPRLRQKGNIAELQPHAVVRDQNLITNLTETQTSQIGPNSTQRKVGNHFKELAADLTTLGPNLELKTSKDSPRSTEMRERFHRTLL